MADNLCGPSTAAKNLTSHFDRQPALQVDLAATRAYHANAERIAQNIRRLMPELANAEEGFAYFRGRNATLASQPVSQFPMGSHTHPANAIAAQASLADGSFNMPLDMHMNEPLLSRAADWATEFSQMTIRRDFDRVNQNPGLAQTTRGFQARYPGLAAWPNPGLHIGQPGMQAPLMPNQPSHGGVNVIDFDAELRAWAAANSPEDQAAVDELFRDALFNPESMCPATNHNEPLEQGVMSPVSDAHQTPEQSPIALEQQAIQTAEAAANVQAEEHAAANEAPAKSQSAKDTELALAAQQILDSVADNETDKFKNSSFVQMMRKIAAQELVVRDNALVKSETPAEGAEGRFPVPSPAVEDAMDE